MLIHRKVTPSSKFADIHLYTWVKRGTVRVKCLAHEHNAVPRPRLEPGSLDLESISCLVINMRCLHFVQVMKFRIGMSNHWWIVRLRRQQRVSTHQWKTIKIVMNFILSSAEISKSLSCQLLQMQSYKASVVRGDRRRATFTFFKMFIDFFIFLLQL